MVANTKIYDEYVAEYTRKYESVSSADVYKYTLHLFPEDSSSVTVLDVGAGSGRDASWFAEKVKHVFAIEPSDQMRLSAKKLHTNSKIQWSNDHLPDLTQVSELGITFDIILVNAVWASVPIIERPKAFYRISNLLNPGGLLLFSIRLDGGRNRDDLYPVKLKQLTDLASSFGLTLEFESEPLKDLYGRNDVVWKQLAFRAEQSEKKGVQLLHDKIIKGDKNGTHKLALLRTLCHINNNQVVLSSFRDQAFAKVPAGLVALIWNKLYIPLFANNLPQRSTNVDYDDVEFATETFKELTATPKNLLQLGNKYEFETASIIHKTLNSSIASIVKSPCQYTKYESGKPIFEHKIVYQEEIPDQLILSPEYFSSFGYFFVPYHVWYAIGQYRDFIEADTKNEWFETIKNYLKLQVKNGQRKFDNLPSDSDIQKNLVWLE